MSDIKRTAVIFIYWDNDDDEMAFYLLDGNYTHLNDIIVGQIGEDEKQEELDPLITKENKISMVGFRAALLDPETALIQCGMFG